QLLESRDAKVFHGKGLGLLSAEGFSRAFLLPEAPRAEVFVGAEFHLEPALPYFHGKDRFYLLCLSHNEVTLWKGDALSLSRIPLEGVETRLDDALHLQRADSKRWKPDIEKFFRLI